MDDVQVDGDMGLRPRINVTSWKRIVSAQLETAWSLLRRDAARWVRPEQFSDPNSITPLALAKLLLRYPSLRAMAWVRIATVAHTLRIRGIPSWTQRRLLRLYGLEIKVGPHIGGGLYIAHPVGCVLVAESIGTDVTVISQVTFGTRGRDSWPHIGDRTFFGAGSRVLGGITVGEGARVGANAVVLRDVPSGATAIGVPAVNHEASAPQTHER